MAFDNQYDGEVVDGATMVQMREIPVCIQYSPTEMLKAYREAVYQDTYREVNRQVNREVYQEVDQDSTEVTYQERHMKSTG
jgi:hypothetical protein